MSRLQCATQASVTSQTGVGDAEGTMKRRWLRVGGEVRWTGVTSSRVQTAP
jgi:hypothetical protein